LSAERLAAIVLLPGEAGAEAAELMASAIDPSVALRPVIFAPEVRGKAFFECQGDAARRLDATWASAVAGQVIPVFIATHELAFEQWVPGLDGLAFIAVEDEEVARNYRAMGARVHALVSRDTRNLIAAVISRLAELGLRGFTAVATTAEKRSSDASELTVAVPVVAAPRASDLGETRAVVPAGAHLPQVAATRLAPPGAATASPFEYLAQASIPLVDVEPSAAGGASARDESAGTVPVDLRSALLARLFRPGRQRATSPRELGGRILQVAPLVVVVASRKGGVGKTASAAGVAVICGLALDQRGASAALVDANIGNPAAWGDLNIPVEAATVRSCISRLNANLEPPPPAYANTPGLACYREDRDQAEGYAADEIHRFCEYLCKRHGAVIVDMPNRLPGMHSAEAEVALHWLVLADVLVLPTDAGPEGIQGVNEYLDECERTLRRHQSRGGTTPAVVPFLAPQTRQVRNTRRLREELTRLADRTEAIIWVPRDERAVLALWTERSITQVSPRLRDAYLSLTDAVIDAVPAHA